MFTGVWLLQNKYNHINKYKYNYVTTIYVVQKSVSQNNSFFTILDMTPLWKSAYWCVLLSWDVTLCRQVGIHGHVRRIYWPLLAFLTFQPKRWRLYVPPRWRWISIIHPRRLYSPKSHSVMSVRTSDRTYITLVLSSPHFCIFANSARKTILYKQKDQPMIIHAVHRSIESKPSRSMDSKGNLNTDTKNAKCLHTWTWHLVRLVITVVSCCLFYNAVRTSE
jgi:hypothetical protein